MSTDLTASQGERPSKTESDLRTPSSQQTLIPKKSSLRGEVFRNDRGEPSQHFEIGGVRGHFTCKYTGVWRWKTENSQTVPIHGWLCKHSQDPSKLHFNLRGIISGTYLTDLLPPGSEFGRIAEMKPDRIRLGFNTVDLNSTATSPPQIFLEALAKTSEQGPFAKLDFECWVAGPRTAADESSIFSSFTYDFDDCQDRLMVFGSVQKMETSEFEKYKNSRALQGSLAGPVYEDMGLNSSNSQTCNVA